jgi:YidC/Oxa1 family membrane protein insertase
MDRKVVVAILLMMVIAIVPTFVMKPAKPPAAVADTSAAAADSAHRAAAPTPAAPQAAAPGAPSGRDSAAAAPGAAAPADTIVARSPLYRYVISTRGAELVSATLPQYRSMAPGERGQPLELVPNGGRLLGLTLVAGTDTLPLDRWTFTATPVARTLDVTAPTPVHFTATEGGVTVNLTYTFLPDEYRIGVTGDVAGLGANGGLLFVHLGHGVRNTEADSVQNARAAALVTKQQREDAHRTDFSSLTAGEPTTVSGPLDWVAVKSKYFVEALLVSDSAGSTVAGARALAPATAGKHPTAADVRASVTVPASGRFAYTIYSGPLEYNRLAQLGHDFYDVNPYGWPGFRTIIRPVAVGVRWLLVWMHTHLDLAYGWVLIFFGLAVRILLWPLNQKAMRSSMAMQAIQPQLKDIQERYKSDPQKQQQEMFKLYKEHGVNPLGGCWPMLLPMPVLLALFFVFQNTIELRGAPFLWIPDLSRPDPLYVIPLLMGLSMFGLSKVGQLGMEPNPQMKVTTYMMPVVMTFLFLNFAAGLNLYYAVSNIASIPQQWMLAKERMRRGARVIAEVKTR